MRFPKVVHHSSHVFVLLGEQSRHEPATSLRVVHRDIGVDVVHGQASVDRKLKGAPEQTHRAGSGFRCYLQTILGRRLITRHMTSSSVLGAHYSVRAYGKKRFRIRQNPKKQRPGPSPCKEVPTEFHVNVFSLTPTTALGCAQRAYFNLVQCDAFNYRVQVEPARPPAVISGGGG